MNRLYWIRFALVSLVMAAIATMFVVVEIISWYYAYTWSYVKDAMIIGLMVLFLCVIINTIIGVIWGDDDDCL